MGLFRINRSQHGRGDRLVVRLNSNVTMTRHKAAAQAVHAALILARAHHGGPVIVLGSNPREIKECEVTVHDAGRTEVEPGTLTAGASWEPTSPEQTNDLDASPDAVLSSECAASDPHESLLRSATIWTRDAATGLYAVDPGRDPRALRDVPGVRALIFFGDGETTVSTSDGARLVVHDVSDIALPPLLTRIAAHRQSTEGETDHD